MAHFKRAQHAEPQLEIALTVPVSVYIQHVGAPELMSSHVMGPLMLFENAGYRPLDTVY